MFVYQELVNTLKQKNLNHFLLCIDGNCGSGKTELSKILAQELNFQVIHIDDFYLPFSKRAVDWKEKIAGNMDFERLYSEVILPYINMGQFEVSLYNAHQDCVKGKMTIDPERPLLIEGSYSSYFREKMDYFVFLKCDTEVQKKRLMVRENMNYENFEKLWIRKEKQFFQLSHCEDKADFVIDTTNLF